MISVPGWLDEILRRFASGLGLKDFSLNADGMAALRFENGVGLRFEYVMDFLTLTMSTPMPQDTAAVKLLLACADPLRQGEFALRVGVLDDPLRAIFVVRLATADVTLGNLDGAMAELWRTVENFRGRLGA